MSSPGAHWHYVYELLEGGATTGLLVKKRVRKSGATQFTDRSLNRLTNNQGMRWFGEPATVLTGVNGTSHCELRFLRMELIQHGIVLKTEREFKE